MRTVLGGGVMLRLVRTMEGVGTLRTPGTTVSWSRRGSRARPDE